MHFRIEPEPPPQEAQAIRVAVEELLARSVETGRTMRFNDTALVPNDSIDIRRARNAVCDQIYPRRYTWHDVARIEALTRGV